VYIVDNVHKNLGNVVKQHRFGKKLSTQELAKILDVSTGLLNNIEHDKTDIFKFELMYKISSVLEIPLLELLLGDSAELKRALPNLIDENNFSSLGCEVEFIRNNISLVIDAYLSTVSTLEYKQDAIKTITEKILLELEYIKKIHR
jgi:transcriptional regulator with XRE-family HTH domain